MINIFFQIMVVVVFILKMVLTLCHAGGDNKSKTSHDSNTATTSTPTHVTLSPEDLRRWSRYFQLNLIKFYWILGKGWKSQNWERMQQWDCRGQRSWEMRWADDNYHTDDRDNIDGDVWCKQEESRMLRKGWMIKPINHSFTGQ